MNIFLLEKYLHIFQLKDYQVDRYFKFFPKMTLVFAIINVIFVVFELIFKFLLITLTCNIILLILNFIFSIKIISSNKTPINYTNKLKRIYLLSSLIPLIFSMLDCCVPLLNLMLPLLPILSNYINIYDKIRNNKFITKAKKKLAYSNAKIIAITGSNGKTSVKNILLKILGKKYRVLASPKSYNTPLGISKFINEELSEDIDYLLLEYGARRRGDIKKLCSLFGADYGIVTMVACQHLESFKSIENIYSTKKELPDFLNKKMCVFNLDNEYTRKMFSLKEGEKIGISLSKSDINASDIKIENYTTHFTLHLCDTKIELSTCLLGKHNVINILLACALCHNLDISPQDMKQSISELTFTPHRLELIRSRINILDDSYNCSIASARESIDVLSMLSGQKMIVTPGIIEGGNEEHSINYQLGKLCTIADYVVVVGTHNQKSIIEGLTSANYPQEKILFSPTLDEAKQYFSILNDNDNLLLLNDLPDDYN